MVYTIHLFCVVVDMSLGALDSPIVYLCLCISVGTLFSCSLGKGFLLFKGCYCHLNAFPTILDYSEKECAADLLL